MVLLEKEQKESTRRPPRGREWAVRYQWWGLITLLSTHLSRKPLDSRVRLREAVAKRIGGSGREEGVPDLGKQIQMWAFSAMSIKAMEGKTFFTIKEE